MEMAIKMLIENKLMKITFSSMQRSFKHSTIGTQAGYNRNILHQGLVQP